jgi:NADPH:quinone reductase-like Zn-dependent oxidoreductase
MFVSSISLVIIFCIVLKKWKVGGKVPVAWFKRNLTGKTIVITGANSGIGLETAKQLAKMSTLAHSNNP